MTPTLTPEPSTGSLATATDSDAAHEIDIIGALLQCLNGSEHYRLSERGGELFLEAAGQPRH